MTEVVFTPAEDMTVQELCILLTPMSRGMTPWKPWTLSPEWWSSMPPHLKRHFELTATGKEKTPPPQD